MDDTKLPLHDHVIQSINLNNSVIKSEQNNRLIA